MKFRPHFPLKEKGGFMVIHQPTAVERQQLADGAAINVKVTDPCKEHPVIEIQVRN